MGKVDFIVSFIMMKYLLSCQDKLVDYFHRILLLQRTTTMIVTELSFICIVYMYQVRERRFFVSLLDPLTYEHSVGSIFWSIKVKL